METNNLIEETKSIIDASKEQNYKIVVDPNNKDAFIILENDKPIEINEGLIFSLEVFLKIYKSVLDGKS